MIQTLFVDMCRLKLWTSIDTTTILWAVLLRSLCHRHTRKEWGTSTWESLQKNHQHYNSCPLQSAWLPLHCYVHASTQSQNKINKQWITNTIANWHHVPSDLAQREEHITYAKQNLLPQPFPSEQHNSVNYMCIVVQQSSRTQIYIQWTTTASYFASPVPGNRHPSFWF